MVYRQLPAWQTRIACRGIPTNSNLNKTFPYDCVVRNMVLYL